MKNIKQTFEFILEVMLFVFAGFLVGIGLALGYFLLILGFIMALITGRRIEKDAIKEWRLENGRE